MIPRVAAILPTKIPPSGAFMRPMTMATNHKTKLLFQERGDLYEHDAVVKGIEQVPPDDTKSTDKDSADTHALFLDETIFHVQGGGQAFDTGTISSLTNSANFRVSAVRHAERNTVRHLGFFVPARSEDFSAGDKVKLSIDVDRRLLNSRLHTAGHVLGVAVMQLVKEGTLPELTEGKAGHYPDNSFVEFKGIIEGRHKEMIQAKTDELVKRALPVTICFWNREECETNKVALPEKVGGENGEIFRTILIEPYGAYACGGTHVPDTSGVGSITVRRISRQKGVSKVSYAVS